MRKLLPIIIITAIGAFALGANRKPLPLPSPALDDSVLQSAVLPSTGVTIPVNWGDLGARLIELGVVDQDKFEAIYANSGGLGENARLLEHGNDSNLIVTPQNSHIILNLLWALGLGNQNPILDTGPMVTYDKKTAGSPAEALAKAGNFASTGGWSLSRGSAMQHYSQHQLIKLSANQQALVEEVSKNIFRPCCNNSTYFPDCNHGMAMLALLELMAAQDINETDMYRYALAVNSYWFPDTYLTIAKYKAGQGISWEQVNPKEVLGENYSSATGYNRVLSQVDPVRYSGGGSCGV